MGLGYLASSLLEYKKDLEVEIIDGLILAESEYQERIADLRADIVGVTAMLPLLNEAMTIPRRVKHRDKNTSFIIGGAGVECLPSRRLYEAGYSIICYGEGERTIVELLQAFENKRRLRDVKGISFLERDEKIVTPPRDRIENLDEIPFPARELMDMERYIKVWKEKMGIAVSTVVSSRGCPFSCKFCDRSVYGRKSTLMSAARIIEEMRLLYDKYKVEMVFFEEDLFTLNKKRVLDFCDAMERELPGKKWGGHARAGAVDLETLRRMKRAGCDELMLGAESGSQRLLDFLGKGFKVEQLIQTFQWTKEVGIEAGMFLIVGIPGETQEDIDLTKRMIAASEPKMISVQFLTPIPGTGIYEATKQLIRDGVDFYNFQESLESVYRKDAFSIGPKERMREIVDFYTETCGDKVDLRKTFFDPSVMEGVASLR